MVFIDCGIVFGDSMKNRSSSGSDDTSDNGFDSDSGSESEFNIGVELIDKQLGSSSWTFNLPINISNDDKLKKNLSTN